MVRGAVGHWTELVPSLLAGASSQDGAACLLHPSSVVPGGAPTALCQQPSFSSQPGGQDRAPTLVFPASDRGQLQAYG